MLDNGQINPDFGTWAFAWVPYCDGSSYTGNNSGVVNANGSLLVGLAHAIGIPWPWPPWFRCA